MSPLAAAHDRLLDGLAAAAAWLLLLMVGLISLNVSLRSLGWGVIAWSDEVSEYAVYAITLLAAPWLLREGRHIRVDIVLRALPRRAAYLCEWLADILGLVSCLWLVVYGTTAAWQSGQSAALSIKTLVMPEWWFLAPLPVCFALLAVEFVFRMRRLARADVGPRGDAVSAA